MINQEHRFHRYTFKYEEPYKLLTLPPIAQAAMSSPARHCDTDDDTEPPHEALVPTSDSSRESQMYTSRWWTYGKSLGDIIGEYWKKVCKIAISVDSKNIFVTEHIYEWTQICTSKVWCHEFHNRLHSLHHSYTCMHELVKTVTVCSSSRNVNYSYPHDTRVLNMWYI